MKHHRSLYTKWFASRYKTSLPLDNDKLVRLGRQAVEVGGFKCGEDVAQDIARCIYMRYEYMRYAT